MSLLHIVGDAKSKMESHVLLFAISCIGTVYAVCYTAYHFVVNPQDAEEIPNWFSWLNRATQNSAGNKSTKIILSCLLAGATLLTGIWIFCWKRSKKWNQRSGKLTKRLVLSAATIGALMLLGSPIILLYLAIVLVLFTILASGFNLATDMSSFYRLIWRISGWLLVLSIPWEYFRLYQNQLVLQYHQTLNGMPPDCRLTVPTWFGAVTAWLRETFSWSDDSPQCLQYHKAMLVHPLWEVTPIMVFVSLLTQCVTHPIEVMAQSIGTSYQQLFKHIPAQWQPIVMLQLILVTVLLVIMLCGYRIRVPLLLHVEPADKQVSISAAAGDCRQVSGKLALQ